MYDLAMVSAIPSIQHGYLDQDFPLHSHDCWELHVFTSGEGFLRQEETAWPVSGGCLTVSPPRTAHEIGVHDSLAFYYVQMDDEKETLRVLSKLVSLQKTGGAMGVGEALLTDLARIKTKLDSPDPDRIQSGIHGFRSWLFDLAAGLSERVPDGIDRALSWLLVHVHERIRLDDWALSAGMDRYAFCRRFKVRTGLSPLAFAHRSKAEAASFLLAGTSLSLGQVAERLGFCDEFHLSRVFRKWRGEPPGSWRRKARLRP